MHAQGEKEHVASIEICIVQKKSPDAPTSDQDLVQNHTSAMITLHVELNVQASSK